MTATFRLPSTSAERALRAALDRLQDLRAVERLWQRDPTLWGTDPAVQRSATARLGWLDAPARMRDALPALLGWSPPRAARVLLVGMGGSSLAPEVMAQVLPRQGPPFLVLDSTAPAAIREAEAGGLDGAVVVVSSKSGTTAETRALAAYLLERAGERARFVAITDPETPLAAQAADPPFVRTFLNPPDVGGRYAALTYVGLVPARLCGVDVPRLLGRTGPMVEACRSPDLQANPGALLAAFLASAAEAGRDKVTLVASPALAPLGAWVEQLLAESTGKAGRGLLPVEGERLGPPEVYGADRLFVRLTLAAEQDEATDGLLERLVRAGHPVVQLVVDDPYDLGQEFFRWEVATALAGALLGINPFDEPDVQLAKTVTDRLLEVARRAGRLPDAPPPGVRVLDARGPGARLSEAFADLLRDLEPPAYAAFLAYAPRTRQAEDALAAMRWAVRDTRRVATVRGYGPRYLHSIGQYFKGGPNTGTFVVVTAETREDLAVPGAGYTFGTLLLAQALGDIGAMAERGRRIMHVRVAESEAGLQTLAGAVHAAVPAAEASGAEVGVPASASGPEEPGEEAPGGFHE
ncbi:MAG: transaldolase [Armatimonadota bacterium]|nr:transaldolase [Armatimonadota bacterium]MDR7449181.1 transaldolase [Armatimonadota bacterium]MDR7459063.1 transaldolase [Armatimonadota bacterium]MDR7479379.1 transaldolase [Armatimonadota bacterium]MDR7487421.1 transaldolase [Armatimonadota bacterium]